MVHIPAGMKAKKIVGQRPGVILPHTCTALTCSDCGSVVGFVHSWPEVAVSDLWEMLRWSIALRTLVVHCLVSVLLKFACGSVMSWHQGCAVPRWAGKLKGSRAAQCCVNILAKFACSSV